MTKILYSTARSTGLAETDALKQGGWLYVVEPTEIEVTELAKKYKLEEDLLRDGLDLYESPRVEREDDDIYIFTRYYHPNNGVINATEPLLIIYRPNCIVTLLREDSMVLAPFVQGTKSITTTQKTKALLQILEVVNSSYQRYVTTVTKKIFSARSQMRRKNIDKDVLLGFVEIEDDLNEFLSALQPQSLMLKKLLNGKYIKLYDDDKDLIEDLLLGTDELIDLVKSRLKTIVTIRESFDALAASELNQIFKRLTSITIFLMVPTIITGLYGMNTNLPLGDKAWSFWYVLGLGLLLTTILIVFFKKRRWL